ATYDRVGRVTPIDTYNASNVDVQTVSYSYDLANNQTRQTSADGSHMDRTFDAIGQVLSETTYNAGTGGAAVATDSSTFDADGEVTRQVNGDGSYTDFTFDTQGRVLTESTYDSNSVLIGYQANSYNEAGFPTQTLDYYGNKTLYTYDLLG